MKAEAVHRVVVVGGGFACLQAVRGLRRAPVEVTLVDRQNFTLFQPLVYQVGTGALSPRPFRYVDKGNLATIGRSKAVTDVKGIHVAGFAAWALWLVVHLYYLIGFQNRLLVLLRWTISFVTRGRGARLILDRPTTGP
jgi:NADH dehydrogenase FAD-containing subunit